MRALQIAQADPGRRSLRCRAPSASFLHSSCCSRWASCTQSRACSSRSVSSVTRAATSRRLQPLHDVGGRGVRGGGRPPRPVADRVGHKRGPPVRAHGRQVPGGRRGRAGEVPQDDGLAGHADADEGPEGPPQQAGPASASPNAGRPRAAAFLLGLRRGRPCRPATQPADPNPATCPPSAVTTDSSSAARSAARRSRARTCDRSPGAWQRGERDPHQEHRRGHAQTPVPRRRPACRARDTRRRRRIPLRAPARHTRHAGRRKARG